VLLTTTFAILLALAFAAFGRAFCRPRQISLETLNLWFLTGAGVSAGILFPLTIAFQGKAVVIVLALLAASLLIAAVRGAARTRGSDRVGVPDDTRDGLPDLRDPVSLLLAALVACGVALFLFLDYRFGFMFDGFQIWAVKAKLLYVRGDLSPLPFTFAHDHLPRVLRWYPPLVPMYGALVSRAAAPFRAEEFRFELIKPVFGVFFLSLVCSTYFCALRLGSRRAALLAAALVSFVPVLISYGAGGYADMPLAAYVAAIACSAASARDRSSPNSPLYWLIASLLMVKAEGAILAAIAMAALAGPVVVESLRTGRGAWRPLLGAIPIAGFAVLRAGYYGWLGGAEKTYQLHTRTDLIVGLRRIPETLRLCFGEAVAPSNWGILWPAFAVALAVLWLSVYPAAPRILGAATAICAACYAGIFLFTQWPLKIHIEQGYPRLLSHLAPAAAVVIAVALCGNPPRGEPSPGRPPAG